MYWERWREWEEAKASHAAWQHAAQSEDWAKDLTDEEREAMQWAVGEQDG